MNRPRAKHWSRREFLSGMTVLGAAGLLELRPEPVAAEPPPETARLRLVKVPGICIAPQYVAETLLEDEGFTDVQYLKTPSGFALAKALANGDADISLNFVGPFIIRVDQGDPIVMLAGVHSGCFELFALQCRKRSR